MQATQSGKRTIVVGTARFLWGFVLFTFTCTIFALVLAGAFLIGPT